MVNRDTYDPGDGGASAIVAGLLLVVAIVVGFFFYFGAEERQHHRDEHEPHAQAQLRRAATGTARRAGLAHVCSFLPEGLVGLV